MPTELITIEYLGTLAGMVAAVTVIVQFTKGAIKKSMADYAVRLYTLAWAWAIQFFVLAVQRNLTAETIGLGILNGFLVALTASGAYEVLADPAATKKKPSAL